MLSFLCNVSLQFGTCFSIKISNKISHVGFIIAFSSPSRTAFACHTCPKRTTILCVSKDDDANKIFLLTVTFFFKSIERHRSHSSVYCPQMGWGYTGPGIRFFVFCFVTFFVLPVSKPPEGANITNTYKS